MELPEQGGIEPDYCFYIAKALQSIYPSAAAEFVRLYLGEFLED
jgi:hypothetical protein